MDFLRRVMFEFLGDPSPDKSYNATGKVASVSNLVEPKTEQKKENWLRLDNPLFIIITIMASVIAGIIPMLINC